MKPSDCLPPADQSTAFLLASSPASFENGRVITDARVAVVQGANVVPDARAPSSEKWLSWSTAHAPWGRVTLCLIDPRYPMPVGMEIAPGHKVVASAPCPNGLIEPFDASATRMLTGPVLVALLQKKARQIAAKAAANS